MNLKVTLIIIFYLFITIIVTCSEQCKTNGIIDNFNHQNIEEVYLDVKIYYTDSGKNTYLKCNPDQKGNWSYNVNLKEYSKDDICIIITPRSSEKDIKFDPGQIILSNNEKIIKEAPVKAYSLDGLEDIYI